MNIDSWHLYNWIRSVRGKKVIIFGTDIDAVKLYHKLNLLDIKVEYFVDDIIESLQGGICGCDVYNYYELLYEEPDKLGFIVTKPENLEKLFNIGVCSRENVDNCLLTFEYNCLKGLYVIDPTVGYNIPGDTEYPGFIFFGDKDAKHTIVTLGGSTTDAIYAAAYKTKCWSEFLSDKLKSEGISARILCGGVVQYKSSQELLKLIRDVIPLQPDMVIVYDGFNDLNSMLVIDSEQRFPFLHCYQKELFSAISRIKGESMFAGDYTFGIDSKWDSYTGWKNYVKMMHLICEGYGIKHISVLQPSFYNQIEKLGGKSDREMWMNYRLLEEYVNAYGHFFYEKDCDEWQPEWLKDFRIIFQGIDDVFYDSCHVYSKGNEIIADKLLDLVKESLLLK